MKILRIRNVPHDLFKRLQKMARAKNRSLNGQVISMLAQAVDASEYRNEQAEILAAIQRRQFKAPKNSPLSLELLRENRGR